MHYLLIYELVPDYVNRRAPLRADHLRHAWAAHGRGEIVLAGNILARQRGTKWHAGRNVGTGKDHTLFALIDGKVQFATKAKGRTYVSVVPMTEAAAE